MSSRFFLTSHGSMKRRASVGRLMILCHLCDNVKNSYIIIVYWFKKIHLIHVFHRGGIDKYHHMLSSLSSHPPIHHHHSLHSYPIILPEHPSDVPLQCFTCLYPFFPL